MGRPSETFRQQLARATHVMQPSIFVAATVRQLRTVFALTSTHNLCRVAVIRKAPVVLAS